MFRKVPLIVILGSTGTGKTKLSIELAERLGGAIISADSMQVYKNLDIVTAKATKEERKQIEHHLLDVATPLEPFTVVHFRNRALPIIENLLTQSTCPIVVGGTNYYIESLLWNVLISSKVLEDDGDDDDAEIGSPEINKSTSRIPSEDELERMQSEYLHRLLNEIDPDSANRLHPKNKRKIIRALQVYQQTGRTLSEKLQEQRQQEGGNRLGGPLRYPHTILFWLRCDQEILNKRLDNRVDSMLEQGLLKEIRSFHNKYKFICSDAESPYTKGILQTIGYKEFIPYLEQFDEPNDDEIEKYLCRNNYKLPSEESFITDQQSLSPCPWPPGLDVLKNCLNELKLVTRRYSKKQIKWIKNRFLASRDRQVPDLYELDTSDVGLWEKNVLSPAVAIIESYRNSESVGFKPMARIEHPGVGLNEEVSNYCDVCQRHFVGEYQWHLHLKSNKHKKRKASLRKLKTIEDD